MEIQLTTGLVLEIQADALRKRTNAQTALTASQTALNNAQAALTRTQTSYEAAQKLYQQADQDYRDAQALKAGGQAQFEWDAINNRFIVRSVEKQDIRPAGWQNNYGWSFPSRSGGVGHEVTVGTDGTVACNCEAGRFGRDCWAKKGVSSAYKGGFSRAFNLYEPAPRLNGVTGQRVVPLGRASTFGQVVW